MESYAKYITEDGKVLDIGCGSGVLLEQLKKLGLEAEGVDIEPDFIACCQKKDLFVTRASIFDYLNSSPSTYAAIFCVHILEHFWPDEVLALLKLCQKRLKLNGALIILTPNSNNLHVITNSFWLDASHKRPYPKEFLQKMLISAGFSIIESGEDQFYLPNSRFRRIVLNAKRLILGRALFNLNYSSGEIFIVAKKEAQGNA